MKRFKRFCGQALGRWFHPPWLAANEHSRPTMTTAIYSDGTIVMVVKGKIDPAFIGSIADSAAQAADKELSSSYVLCDANGTIVKRQWPVTGKVAVAPLVPTPARGR